MSAVDPRRRFGDRGEDLATVFLISKGFTILHRNWSCRLGEIDVIGEKEGTVHFIEVKTRKTTAFGYPEEAITRTKLRHLRLAIECYLQTSRVPLTRYQADALSIQLTPGQPPEFYYIENI